MLFEDGHRVGRQSSVTGDQFSLFKFGKIDQLGEGIFKFWFDLFDGVSEGPIGRLGRPREETTSVKSVGIAVERASQLVWLKAAGDPDEEVFNIHWCPVHALDLVRFAVPRFEPKLFVGAAGVPLEIEE